MSNIMLTETKELNPYLAPQLDPYMAKLINAFCSRFTPVCFKIANKNCRLSFVEPRQTEEWQALEVLSYSAGSFIWKLDFASSLPFYLHSSLSDVDINYELPKALKMASLELSFGAILNQLSIFLQTNVKIEQSQSETEASIGYCNFNLEIYDAEPNLEQATIVPLRLRVPSAEAANWLVSKLNLLAFKKTNTQSFKVKVALETGSLNLTLKELRELELEDILLVPNYLAQAGSIILRIDSRHFYYCALKDNAIKLIELVSSPLQEKNMQNEVKNGSQAAQDSSDDLKLAKLENKNIAIDQIEVPVTFELEQRLMSVAELQSLSPGYTFALGVDPLAPVALKVNGQVIGQGRLVDLGGTLGVQISALQSGLAATNATDFILPSPEQAEDLFVDNNPDNLDAELIDE